MAADISKLKIAGVAACVTCLLYSSGLLVVFTPFPLYFVSVVYGKKIGRLTAFVSLLIAVVLYIVALPLFHGLADKWPLAKLVFLIPGAGLVDFFNIGSAQYFGLLYLLYFLLFGYLFSEGAHKKWPISTWFAVSVGATFALLALAVLALRFAGVPVFDEMQRYMQSVLDELVTAQESAGLTSDRIFALKKNATEIVKFSTGIIPAVVLLIGLMVAVINQMLARWMIRTPAGIAHFSDVNRYSIPGYFLWITIILGFSFYIENYIYHSAWLRYLSLNGLIVCAGIYFLQGLIIVSFYTGRFKGRFLRAMVYIMIFMMFQVMAPIIALMGFLDLWFNFRRLKAKEINKRSVSCK